MSKDEIKFRAFLFEWGKGWKYFEKYLKHELKIREYPGISQRRQQILAFIKRVLNDNRIGVITKENISELKKVLEREAKNNKFFQQASQYFTMFLEKVLS